MAGPLSPRRVLLQIEASSDFTSRLIRGVASYSQAFGPWFITLCEGEREDHRRRTEDLSSFDGIIARMECKQTHQRFRKSRLPFVNVGGTSFSETVPWVTVNNESIVRLVFHEFQSNNHTDFAFFGPVRQAWGCERESGFRTCVLKSGHRFHGSFSTKLDALDDPAEISCLQSWLQGLPTPIGIMAANDFCGHHLLAACHRVSINVPDEIAVIGVNNDEVLCGLSFPSLTSVSTNTERIGHKAAEILDELMAGRELPATKVVVEPLGIEPRRSTDRTAGVDPFVGLAFRFIQRHACDGINVEDVLKVVPMSRTSLETAFRQFVGRSLHHEIARIRIARAQQLLAEEQLRIGDIAVRCGYSTVEYFSTAFKREVGVSPTQYRRTGYPNRD